MPDTVIRIGVLTPHVAAGPEAELPAMAPGRVMTCVARVASGAPALLDAGAEMLGQGSLGAIVYASTSSAYSIGFDAEAAVESRLSRRAGIPVVSTCSSAVHALRVLDVDRIAIVDPPWFDAGLNELGAAYFRGAGFDVLSSVSADLSQDPRRIEAADVFEWTSRHVGDDAEAVFIGGNGFRAAGAIADLEDTIGRPVLTSNQVLLWNALELTGAPFEVRGYGRLFARKPGRRRPSRSQVGLDGPTETRFTFESDGETLVGNLFSPENGNPIGAVIAVGPLTSVKEQAAGTYAQAMAERGYAALAFDYRYFGESGGTPRQFANPNANIEDIRNAATALLADDGLADLPLFGLGVCFGAGPMIRTVAEDSRFRAFAGVAGVYTDNSKIRAAMGAAYEAKLERGRDAEQRWRETGEAETIPAVAPDGGDVAMPLREAYEFYGTPRGQVPNYVNGYAVQSLAYSLPFDARGAAGLIDVPVLLVHSEKALAPDLARAFYAAVKSPKEELWLDSQGQIDFYDDPKLITPAADAVAAFLRRERSSRRPSPTVA
jgi:uncharacterized protein